MDPTHMDLGMVYLCLTHGERFESLKLWDDHLNHQHPGWNAGAFE